MCKVQKKSARSADKVINVLAFSATLFTRKSCQNRNNITEQNYTQDKNIGVQLKGMQMH